MLGQSLVENKNTAGLFIFAGIKNTGFQSVAMNFRVSAKKDGSLYQGTIMGVSKTTIVTALMPAIGGMSNIILHDEDVLYNKGNIPIPSGGIIYGFLMVSFPNISDFRVLQGGPEISIIFNDVFGKEYAIKQISTSVTTSLPRIVLPGMHTEFP